MIPILKAEDYKDVGAGGCPQVQMDIEVQFVLQPGGVYKYVRTWKPIALQMAIGVSLLALVLLVLWILEQRNPHISPSLFKLFAICWPIMVVVFTIPIVTLHFFEIRDLLTYRPLGAGAVEIYDSTGQVCILDKASVATVISAYRRGPAGGEPIEGDGKSSTMFVKGIMRGGDGTLVVIPVIRGYSILTVPAAKLAELLQIPYD